MQRKSVEAPASDLTTQIRAVLRVTVFREVSELVRAVALPKYLSPTKPVHSKRS